MHEYHTTKRASYKRLILVADGTWLSSNLGTPTTPSNAAKIARAISPTGINDKGELVQQIVSYHSGLGTGAMPGQQALYGGLGWGLGNDVCQVYDFIANNFEQGDELFFFGFSRGAFTVRSVAGLVCDIGVLSAVAMSHFPKMWTEYRKNTSGRSFKQSKWFLDHEKKLGLQDVKIKVVGVWETVGALGVPEWPLVHWVTKNIFPINKQYAWHNTRLSDCIENAFHALGLDEKRTTFPPTLWHKAHDCKSNLEQCWFPGVHSNIGGQAEMFRSLGDHEEIGDNTFAWMVDNCAHMLTFEHEAINNMIKQHQEAENWSRVPNGWGSGRIVDVFWGPVGLFFWFLGQTTRKPGGYVRDRNDHSTGETYETFHPTVRIRKRKVSDWKPAALRGFTETEPKGSPKGSYVWTWQKDEVDHPISEYVMKKDKKMKVAHQSQDKKTWTFSDQESLSRRLCPHDILRELDADNHLN